MTPPATVVEGLTLSLGDFHLGTLDFAIGRGEVLVILGPNGSGKSVTLECIAGFHRPDAGRVLIGGRDVTALPPERRNVAFLVQNFGLFPHLTVAQNVAIALKPAGASAAKDEVGKLLDRLEVAALAQRTPQTLSPGQKQRVALARALAAQPDLFLFDEPFSALDAQTRNELRADLLAFMQRLSLPAIFVTHDHSDALTLADKIIVLNQGRRMQAGTAEEIFHKPASSFVARFVGVENVLVGHIGEMRDGLVTIMLGGQLLQAVTPVGPMRGTMQVCIGAEAITLIPPGSERPARAALNRFTARIAAVRSLGPLATVELDGSFPLKAYALARQAQEMEFLPGRAVAIEIPAAAIHLMAD